jgi:hypothetical protein
MSIWLDNCPVLASEREFSNKSLMLPLSDV